MTATSGKFHRPTRTGNRDGSRFRETRSRLVASVRPLAVALPGLLALEVEDPIDPLAPAVVDPASPQDLADHQGPPGLAAVVRDLRVVVLVDSAVAAHDLLDPDLVHVSEEAHLPIHADRRATQPSLWSSLPIPSGPEVISGNSVNSYPEYTLPSCRPKSINSNAWNSNGDPINDPDKTSAGNSSWDTALSTPVRSN